MTVNQRYDGIQTVLEHCGSDGCHFLSLCSIIEDVNKKPVDLIDTIRRSMSKGWVAPDFFVRDAIKVLEFYTAKRWVRRGYRNLPLIGERDYTEAVYFNKRTNLYHYRRRGFDTLDHSVTVEEGKIVKYYVYTWSEA